MGVIGKWTRLLGKVPRQYDSKLTDETNRERIDRLAVLSLFMFLIGSTALIR